MRLLSPSMDCSEFEGQPERFFAVPKSLDISRLRRYLAVQIKDAKPGKTFKDHNGKDLSFREVCDHDFAVTVPCRQRSDG
jgi:hypothetical protein